MLRNIPANLSPNLVKILLEMGHGDEILLADANFPGHHLHPTTVRADGLGIPDLRTSILTLMPLDRMAFYDDTPSVYAVVLTGETALYGNLILKKGVL